MTELNQSYYTVKCQKCVEVQAGLAGRGLIFSHGALNVFGLKGHEGDRQNSDVMSA